MRSRPTVRRRVSVAVGTLLTALLAMVGVAALVVVVVSNREQGARAVDASRPCAQAVNRSLNADCRVQAEFIRRGLERNVLDASAAAKTAADICALLAQFPRAASTDAVRRDLVCEASRPERGAPAVPSGPVAPSSTAASAVPSASAQPPGVVPPPAVVSHRPGATTAGPPPPAADPSRVARPDPSARTSPTPAAVQSAPVAAGSPVGQPSPTAAAPASPSPSPSPLVCVLGRCLPAL